MSIKSGESISRGAILAAGEGKRMLPVTKSTSKPMLTLMDRHVVDFSVAPLLMAGISDISFVVDAKAEGPLRKQYGDKMSAEQYVEERHNLPELLAIRDRPELAKGISFRYIRQDMKKYGTARAAALCAGLAPLVMTTGDDGFYDPNGSWAIDQLIRQTAAQHAEAGMLVTPVPRAEAGGFGIVETKMTSTGLVLAQIVEGPDPETVQEEMPWANASTYLVDQLLMDHIQAVADGSPAANGEYQIPNALNMYEEPLAVIPGEGKFINAGTTSGFAHAVGEVYRGLVAQGAA